MRFEPREIVARMNAIGLLSSADRESFRRICGLVGHQATGEQFMTAQPIDMCFICGSEYISEREKQT